ncbi:hypothetical protein ACROYT_G001913 [Oculina patagonica]
MESTLPTLEQQLTCSLCSNTYKKPKILACYHSFCCDCLEKHASESQKDGKFNCPECETEVPIPDGNRFDDLPTSFHHCRLLSYLAIRQSEKGDELKCAKCNLNKGPEIHYCFECGSFLCRECLLKTISKGHRAKAVSDFQVEDFEAMLNPKSFCIVKYHEGKLMEFFCRDCKRCICQSCINTEHRNHNIDPLDKVCDEEKSDLLASAELAKEKQRAFEEVIQQFELAASELEANIAAAKQGLSEAAEQMIAAIRERAEEANEVLQKTLVSRTENLSSAKQQLKSVAKQIHQAAEFTNNLVQGGSSNGIMWNKEGLEQRFEELCKSKVPSLPGYAPFVKFFPTCEPESLKLGFIVWKTATCEGLSQTFQAGLEAELTLRLHTPAGEVWHKNLRDQVEVFVEPTEEVASLIVREKEDGNFQVKFTPKIPGTYTIDVKLNTVALEESPYTVQVQQRRFSVVLVSELHTSKGGRVKRPRGIAVNKQGEIAITDYEGHCVVHLDNAGRFIKKLGSEGESEGHFKHPADVAFLSDDEILVVDEWNYRIQQFNVRTGNAMKSFGRKGARDGEFQNPLSVCIDETGQVIVSDWLNDRIQILTANGQPVLTVGTSGPHQISRPLSCTAHKNELIASDGVDHCVKVFDRLGQFLYKFGGEGTVDGYFNKPSAVCVDCFGNVLVCDANNGRVQQFTIDGRFTGKSSGVLQSPSGIAVAPDGRILVTDGEAGKRYCLS